MSEKKFLLVPSPQPKRVRNYIISAILIFWGDEHFDLLSDNFMTIFWPALAFITVALFLFTLAVFYKIREERHSIKFSEYGLAFRNKGAGQKKISKTDLLKVEIGKYSATFYQINGQKSVLNFEDAKEDDKEEIKLELQTYATLNN